VSLLGWRCQLLLLLLLPPPPPPPTLLLQLLARHSLSYLPRIRSCC
jgi:hypothetical protein